MKLQEIYSRLNEIQHDFSGIMWADNKVVLIFQDGEGYYWEMERQEFLDNSETKNLIKEAEDILFNV